MKAGNAAEQNHLCKQQADFWDDGSVCPVCPLGVTSGG